MIEFPDRRIVLAAAHRGNAIRAPENTMAAFQQAVDLGADAIETDVRLCRDGVPILFHDDDLARVTGITGHPGDIPLADLRRLDAAATHPGEFRGEVIPTLEELSTLCRDRLRMILDLKMDGTAPAIARVLRNTGVDRAQVLVCAWNEFQADEIRRHLDGVKLIHLGEGPYATSSDWFRELAAQQYAGLSLSRDGLNSELVANAQDHGLAVITWTVNRRLDMIEAIGYGVDGIITDDVALLLQTRAVTESR